MPVQFQNWGDAIMVSVSQALAIFLAAIPKVIGFSVILIVGWFLASLLAKGVASLLRTVRFNDLAQRSGFSEFVRSTGVERDASGFLALIAKWFVRLLTLVVAFDALGLPAVSDVLRQMLLWLPNVVVALVVLVIPRNRQGERTQKSNDQVIFRLPRCPLPSSACGSAWSRSFDVAVLEDGKLMPSPRR